MKKITALITFLILFTAFTCENEPLEGDFVLDSDSIETIQGTWKLTSWIGEEPIDLNNDGASSLNFLEEMNCYQNETMLFNADNTGVINSTTYAEIEMELEVGTTDSYNFTVNCISEIENTDFSWTQNGNTISVTDEYNDTYDFSLNGNQLSIIIPDGFFAANEDFTVTTIQDLTFVYTKQ